MKTEGAELDAREKDLKVLVESKLWVLEGRSPKHSLNTM